MDKTFGDRVTYLARYFSEDFTVADISANVHGEDTVNKDVKIRYWLNKMDLKKMYFGNTNIYSLKNKEDRIKNPAAVSLGRLGGLKGGKARANNLTLEQLSEIGRKGAEARWGNNND